MCELCVMLMSHWCHIDVWSSVDEVCQDMRRYGHHGCCRCEPTDQGLCCDLLWSYVAMAMCTGCLVALETLFMPLFGLELTCLWRACGCPGDVWVLFSSEFSAADSVGRGTVLTWPQAHTYWSPWPWLLDHSDSFCRNLLFMSICMTGSWEKRGYNFFAYFQLDQEYFNLEMSTAMAFLQFNNK